MRPWRFMGLVMAGVGAVGLAWWMRDHRIGTAVAAPSGMPAWVGLTVGEDTTLLTEPLKADGTVDYVGAINRRFGEGVTPENNAVVALLPAIGSGGWELKALGDMEREELKALGAEKSDGLLVEWKLEARGGEGRGEGWELLRNQEWSLQRMPWKPAESREFDAWVNANEECLKVVAEAVTRPRYWMPLVTKDGTLTTANVPFHAGRVSAVEMALRMRAMRSLSGGDAAGAWKDLWTAHRLNHLMSQETWLISALVAEMSESRTCEADLALLQSPAADKVVLGRMIADLRGLSAMPVDLEKLRRQELYSFPDAVQEMASRFRRQWERITPKQRSELEAALGITGFFFPDWDRMAEYGNRFNQAIFESPEFESAAGLRKWQQDRDAQYREMMEAAKKDLRVGDANAMGGVTDQFMWPRVGETRDAYSDRLARMLLSVMTPEVKGLDEKLRMHKQMELTPLACALVLWRLENGAYPEKAEEAAEKYLGEMPQGFWGRAVIYSHDAGGFRLEVWGPGAETEEEVEKGDRVVVEVRRR